MLNRNLYANPRNLGFGRHKRRDYAIKTGSPSGQLRETSSVERMDRASHHEVAREREGDKVVGGGKFTEDVGTRYKSRP